ncbi:TPA: PrgI family protein [Streptococcus equi subsp. zooepidemicus]|uniref:PrgI family protein n=1 Tax=Streptococcus equi TaxID=1336 RepID=UPI0005A299D2|nr:PrgI family protein [Streptococcus equi]MCD3367202.1 PrgI family protein [Streptococcus equi subsp. zooepidemicus]MCD3389542.1 PrgI family protein [Streptococcus equi subsp. zooepidemicus]MCD3398148.1 PrgI family protein [Streptococcus equi subsp. zooepidemicus]MCD3405748.1 PrgI family protein [Streptococcus equi subsp. zooepidemicus]MCD3407413.1 PrgI family protein [Streptococcus equi subsp. zooepidemicus]
MNTRVFKDITKVQHRAWLGFTTRQVIFVLPAIAIPLMLFGVYRPNDLPFETYLNYRWHYEMTIPDRTLTGQKGIQREKNKSLNETKDLF